jgi:hypothetical protein
MLEDVLKWYLMPPTPNSGGIRISKSPKLGGFRGLNKHKTNRVLRVKYLIHQP